MRKLVFIILIFYATLLSGQEMNFIQADSTTYNQYLKGEWKELIETGNVALENGIDYYFLQMRMAYAWFSLEKYRQAIPHYKNALALNANDPIATEYLYYSYLYSGRESDALLVRRNLTDSQKANMGIVDSIPFISLGASFTYATSNPSGIIDNITNLSPDIDGVQKAPLSFLSPVISLSHRLGTNITIEHKGTYLTKDEISYTISNGQDYLSPVQTMNQFEYSLNAKISVVQGLYIQPGIHYLNSRVPLFDETSYGMSAGRDRVALSELVISNWVASILIETQLKHFDFGLSYVHHTFNQISSMQFGMHTTVYPLSNLNLYLTLDAYLQTLQQLNQSETGYIIKPRMGIKMHKNLWLEFAGTFPENLNFYDVRNTIAYNNIEKTSSGLEVIGIIPLYKPGVKLFIGYQYRKINSYFFPLENMLEPFNKQSYSIHLITGGIKWTK